MLGLDLTCSENGLHFPLPWLCDVLPSPHGSFAQWVSASVIVQLFAQVAWSSHAGDFQHGDHVLVAALPHLVRFVAERSIQARCARHSKAAEFFRKSTLFPQRHGVAWRSFPFGFSSPI